MRALAAWPAVRHFVYGGMAMTYGSGHWLGLVALLVGVALQGCSSAPVRPGAASRLPPASSSVHSDAPLGSEIAMRAMSLLGTPYRYGGEEPGGFDCSGLVRFVHRQIGIGVPRTAAEQYAAAAPIDVKHLQPGDLLFFKLQGARVSHVAIYTGEYRFIHAPQTGRSVELRTLDDAYYRPRLVGAGRLF